MNTDMKTSLNRIILIVTVSCFFLSAHAQVISEWRGPGRTGVYNETGLLTKWPEGGPKLLWSVTGLAKGNSSVAIGKDKIYLTGTKGDIEVLIALDMKGNRLWETPYGRAFTESFTESRATPTIDGNRIYVTSGMLDAACVDAETGKIIWSKKVNDDFSGAMGTWGKCESPIVLGEKVFFTPAGNKTTMVALNKMTGETIWQSESLNDISSYVSPLLVDINGKQIIVQVTQNYIIGVSPQDGKILWKFNFGALTQPDGANIHANTPLYWNQCLFVTSGYDHPNVMLKLADDGNSVTELWSDKTLDNHHGGVVRIGSYIYGSNWINNNKGRWVCLDWNTGKPTYETDWYNKGQIIADDGMLYCYEEKTGNFALVKATPEKFDIVSAFKVPLGSGPHWPHPVISNGILYVRHGDALMAYDIKSH